MDFLRDPIWTFIACCIGAVGVFIPILATALMGKKRLVCEVINNSTIITVAEDVKQRLQITIDGQSIANARLISLKFTNTGFLPIKESDYAENLQVIFSPSSEVLEANIIGISPKSLNPIIDFSENQISIKPIMLNRNDYFIVKILVKGDSPDIVIKDRILGIKNITLLDGVSKTENQFIATRIGVVAVIELAAGFVFCISLASFAIALSSSASIFYKVSYAIVVSGNLLITIFLAVFFPYNVYKSFKK